MYGKYHASKTEYAGIRFDSSLEAQFYREEVESGLKSGYITNLVLQPSFVLIPDFVKGGKAMKGVNYIADFQFFDHRVGRLRIVDVKGMQTEEFILRRKMFDYRYADLCLEVVTYAKYCGWVGVDRMKELVSARRLLKGYLKDLREGKLSRQRKLNALKLVESYRKYLPEKAVEEILNGKNIDSGAGVKGRHN